MDDFVDLGAEEDEAAAPPPSTSTLNDDHILKTRTYDISVTYDKYHQTPGCGSTVSTVARRWT